MELEIGKQGPLYSLSLPSELLNALEPRQIGVQTVDAPAESSNGVDETRTGSTVACAACGVAAFDSLAEHRAHAKSDWHRYNVKLRLQGAPAVSEAQFAGLVDCTCVGQQPRLTPIALADGQSLSGSDSSTESDASSSSSTGAVGKLLKQSELKTAEEADETPTTGPRSPLIWFTAESAAPSTQFGIYRAIVPSSVHDPKARTEPSAGWRSALASIQVVPQIPKAGKKAAAGVDGHPFARLAEGVEPTDPAARTWTMLMVGGGHFAGMVVSLVPKLTRGQGGRLERDVSVFAHKTVHRYTTRRKQGGGQSANDNAKGKAKSAGAQIRRYNETMLQEDIRTFLNDNRELIDRSELIFMRSSKSNYRIFVDYEDAVIGRADPRLRNLPFPTRRPTLAELTRCFNELTKVKLSHLSAEALAALDAEYLESLKPKPAPVVTAPQPEVKAPEVPKLSKEEELLRDRWDRVIDMVKRGRVDALAQFVDRHEETNWLGRLPDWLLPESTAPSRLTPTLLHVASAADQADVVRWLLFDRSVDPTLSSLDPPITGVRTAYEMAASRTTRNVFRRCMAERPDAFDWIGDARVPSALTEELEAEQKDKGKDRKAKMREQIRARDAERAAAEATKEAEQAKRAAEVEAERQRKLAATPSRGPQKLGGANATSSRTVAAAQSAAGLTDAQRAAIMREQRARAAEARLTR